MMTAQRHEKIMEYLQGKDHASVPELLDLLNISESTLRRDLMTLEAQGKCRRVRGGVSSRKQTRSMDSLMEKRRTENLEQKRQIGKRAAALVEPGDLIYIDAGTTTEAMLPYLNQPGIRAVTNSISHASMLSSKGIPVTLVGGEFKSLTNALVGEEALAFLEKYHFAKGFFGTNAISEDGELLTPDLREAAVKRSAMVHSMQRYVLADSSKLSRYSSVRFGNLDSALLICEQNARIPEDLPGLTLYSEPEFSEQEKKGEQS